MPRRPFCAAAPATSASLRAWPALLTLGAIGVAAQESLLVSNVELIHFPQFALLAGLILAAGLGAETAWLLATVAGIADETYQYLVLYAGVPNIYLDYNDMVLNAIGAAYAVCLFVAAGGRSTAATSPSARPWRKAAIAAVPGLFLARALDRSAAPLPVLEARRDRPFVPRLLAARRASRPGRPVAPRRLVLSRRQEGVNDGARRRYPLIAVLASSALSRSALAPSLPAEPSPLHQGVVPSSSPSGADRRPTSSTTAASRRSPPRAST